VASDVMSAVAVVAQAHTRVDGIWFVFLLLLSVGVVLVLTGAASLVTRRLRGHDAPPGQTRGMERAAGGSLRIGRVMTVIGGLGFGFWWVVVR
jgi:uncharacterized membrane protein YedE/YeeE